jgi:hypothetical protein
MPKPKPWWLRKRLLLPIGVLVAFGLILVLTYIRSDTAKIIVYNDSGRDLGRMILSACGQQFEIPALAHDQSYRLRLSNRGTEGEVELRVVETTNWNFKGGYVEPTGGYRVRLRLTNTNVVEYQQQISFFHKTFTGVGQERAENVIE